MPLTPQILDKRLYDIANELPFHNQSAKHVLEAEGYISIIRTNMGDVCQITNKGKAFLEQGGYTVAKIKEEDAKREEIQKMLEEKQLQYSIELDLMKREHSFQSKLHRNAQRRNTIGIIISTIISILSLLCSLVT